MAVVFRVMTMLVYFEPTPRCVLPPDMFLAPLPAKKQLWEAGDERLWRAEADRNKDEKHGGGSGGSLLPAENFGLTSAGEIVRLGGDDRPLPLSCYSDRRRETPPRPRPAGADDGDSFPQRAVASWEEWSEGMDDLGGLVMLAASLIA